MKENILITGATGYIGSNLARYCIKNGYNVSILIRKGSKLSYLMDIENDIKIFEYDGDILKLSSYLIEKNIKAVFHLASLYITEHKSEDVDNLIDSNIKLGAEILESMKNSKVELFINTSTTWQHYKKEGYNPVNLYAATKEAFEGIIKYYVEKKYVRSITLEIFDTYGEGDNRNKLLNNLSRIEKNKEVLLMSEGEQTLDLVYIKDIIEGYTKALELLQVEGVQYKKYALCSGEPISLKSLVKLYEDVKGVKLNIRWGERPYREREVMEPSYIIEKLPDWTCSMTIEEGIKKIK